MLLAYRLKFFGHMCYYFTVCPVPRNKEEEEFIKERERNRELMEEIAREIEMTCLGKLKNKWITIIKTLNEQVLPSELKALLNSLFFGAVRGQLGVSNMEQCRFCISKASYPFSLIHLVVKQRIQEVIHTYTIHRRPFWLLNEITHPAQERLLWLGVCSIANLTASIVDLCRHSRALLGQLT